MMKPFRKKAKPGPEEKDLAFFNSAVEYRRFGGYEKMELLNHSS
jgi:hypothetical protein